MVNTLLPTLGVRIVAETLIVPVVVGRRGGGGGRFVQRHENDPRPNPRHLLAAVEDFEWADPGHQRIPCSGSR